MDTLRDICKGVSAKRAEARARLAKEAQPGSTWGADGYKFGVLVVGEVAPKTLRCARFDGEAFTGSRGRCRRGDASDRVLRAGR